MGKPNQGKGKCHSWERVEFSGDTLKQNAADQKRTLELIVSGSYVSQLFVNASIGRPLLLCFTLGLLIRGNHLESSFSRGILESAVSFMIVLGRKLCVGHLRKRQRNRQGLYRSGAMIFRRVNSDITSLTISGRPSSTELGSGVLLVALQIIRPSFLVVHTSIPRMSTF